MNAQPSPRPSTLHSLHPGLLGVALAVLAVVAAWPPEAAVASPPVAVYHSPSGDGTPPNSTPIILEQTTTTLHLFVDGGSSPAAFAPCELDPGDDLCAYTLDISAQGNVSFDSFLPVASDLTVNFLNSRMRLNGGDFASGELGPVFVGDLVVSALGVGSVRLDGGASVRSPALVESLPARDLVMVPEPGSRAGLLAGSILLAGITWRRSGRAGFRSRRLAGIFATALLLLLTSTASAQTLFFGRDAGSVQELVRIDYSPPDGGGLVSFTESVVATESGGAADELIRGVALDGLAGKVYWLFGPDALGESTIKRANLDGSSPELVLGALPFLPCALAVDPIGGWVYWSANVDSAGQMGFGQLFRTDFAGSFTQLIVPAAAFQDASIDAVAVDPSGTFLYYGQRRDLHRANLDGSADVILATGISLGLQDIASIAFDLPRGKLYLAGGSALSTGFDFFSMARLNLDGSVVESSLASGTSSAAVIDPGDGKVYTRLTSSGGIERFDVLQGLPLLPDPSPAPVPAGPSVRLALLPSALLDIDGDGVFENLAGVAVCQGGDTTPCNDNCPLTHNPDQADTGGRNSSLPDGTGDACQRGDIDGDGDVDAGDIVILRRDEVGLLPGFAPAIPTSPGAL